MFLDDPDCPDATPTKILNGAGNMVHKGHGGDICTVAFHEPNWLATGSVDGAIVLWNIEAGTIRFSVREPFILLRNQEEKPVEKVLFLKDPVSQQLALVSCHADGTIRFWDLNAGVLLTEVHACRQKFL